MSLQGQFGKRGGYVQSARGDMDIMAHKLIAVRDLVPGIMVDLAGDQYADTGTHPEFEFEYAQVCEVQRETVDCTAVYFDAFACGFPPDHKLPCRADTLPLNLYVAEGQPNG